MSKAESEILEQINQGFSNDKWKRLQFLDWKLETGELDEAEALESLHLAEAYEQYTLQRLQLLIRLAALRNMTLDEVMTQLKVTPLAHG